MGAAYMQKQGWAVRMGADYMGKRRRAPKSQPPGGRLHPGGIRMSQMTLQDARLRLREIRAGRTTFQDARLHLRGIRVGPDYIPGRP